MERFRATTNWTVLELTSEPYIVLTFRGYIPAVRSRELPDGPEYELLIGGIKSLAQGIEPLKTANDGQFKGLRFRIKKETADRSSPYLIDQERADGQSAQHDVSGNAMGKSISLEDRLWHRIVRRHGS